MALYRGRRVNAVQWYPPGDPRYPGPHPDVEVLYRGDRTTFHKAHLRSPLHLSGINTGIDLKPGDWVVTTRGGATMIFKPDVFDDLFEQVP